MYECYVDNVRILIRADNIDRRRAVREAVRQYLQNTQVVNIPLSCSVRVVDPPPYTNESLWEANPSVLISVTPRNAG
jgi:hypothetical protein